MHLAIALAVLVCAIAAPAGAADWGGIVPGATTMDEVRARYGGPTRTTAEKTEGYDTASWTYEGSQAPTGMKRMVIEFGLVSAGQFRRDVVRTFRLEPNAGAFDRRTILAGWGPPSRAGREADADIFVYAEGLIVYFEKDDFRARMMIFTPPQPLGAAPTK